MAVAVDRFHDGELDAFDVDHVLFQYSRAAKEPWQFCSMTHVEITTRHVHEGQPRERRSLPSGGVVELEVDR